jgi:ATP phosphoribosyltransferase regulatory subunit
MNKKFEVMLRDEEYSIGLRRLFESFGYKKFKMRKFEKYELYLENKSFLRNGNIITVTDPKGRLLAIKPDVTLSIVKNVRADILPEKFYYNESVYIADIEDGSIKESTQIGLEYIGNLDLRALAEILYLASESLSRVDSDYRIAISHMSFVSDILIDSGLEETERNQIVKLISEKNLHGIKALCGSLNVDEAITERICSLAFVCGELREEIKIAKRFVCGNASRAGYEELVALSEVIEEFGLSDKFILDFSLMNDMNYYNGLVFQGFIQGVPKNVLSGGRYDNLVRRFGVETSAAGFAVFTDVLDKFRYESEEFDYDIFLLYSNKCKAETVLKKELEFTNQGLRCIAFDCEPEGLKYKKKAVLSSDGSIRYE